MTKLEFGGTVHFLNVLCMNLNCTAEVRSNVTQLEASMRGAATKNELSLKADARHVEQVTCSFAILVSLSRLARL